MQVALEPPALLLGRVDDLAARRAQRLDAGERGGAAAVRCRAAAGRRRAPRRAGPARARSGVDQRGDRRAAVLDHRRVAGRARAGSSAGRPAVVDPAESREPRRAAPATGRRRSARGCPTAPRRPPRPRRWSRPSPRGARGAAAAAWPGCRARARRACPAASRCAVRTPGAAQAVAQRQPRARRRSRSERRRRERRPAARGGGRGRGPPPATEDDRHRTAHAATDSHAPSRPAGAPCPGSRPRRAGRAGSRAPLSRGSAAIARQRAEQQRAGAGEQRAAPGRQPPRAAAGARARSRASPAVKSSAPGASGLAHSAASHAARGGERAAVAPCASSAAASASASPAPTQRLREPAKGRPATPRPSSAAPRSSAPRRRRPAAQRASGASADHAREIPLATRGLGPLVRAARSRVGSPNAGRHASCCVARPSSRSPAARWPAAGRASPAARRRRERASTGAVTIRFGAADPGGVQPRVLRRSSRASRAVTCERVPVALRHQRAPDVDQRIARDLVAGGSTSPTSRARAWESLGVTRAERVPVAVPAHQRRAARPRDRRPARHRPDAALAGGRWT